jgi:hypothetical protein
MDKISHSQRTPCPWGRWQGKLDAKSLSRDEKLWLGAEIVSGRQTPKTLTTKYGIGTQRLSDYKKAASSTTYYHGSRGRPSKIDSPIMREILAAPEGLYKTEQDKSNAKLAEAAQKTAIKRGISTVQNSDMCTRTITRAKKRFKMKSGFAEKVDALTLPNRHK